MRTLPFVLMLAAASLHAQSTVTVDLTVAPGTIDLGPGYASEPAWLYGGSAPGPVIRATVGDTLRVRLRNELPVSTILHFHGQPVRLGMDGTQVISRPEIAPGQEFEYEFTDLAAGTYWYHPHSDMHHQLDAGMYGVLIVDPPASQPDPAFDVEQVIVLDDWSASVTGGTFNGSVLNGRTSDGQIATTVQSGETLRLRIVNCAARTNYVVALDGHAMTVTHSDGNRLQPVTVDAIPIGIGERYDVLVDCNNPGVWSLAASPINNRNTVAVRGVVRYQGEVAADPAPTFVPSNLSSGTLLSYAMLASYWPAAQPITATPDRTYPVAVAQSFGPSGVQWTINGDAWPNVTPFQVATGEVVQFDLTTSTPGLNHYHPMHMHGHFVQIMGTAGGATHPPRKDTVLIAPSGQAGDAYSVQFVADNPGRWLYHCHEMMHMALGMMTTLDYVGDFDGDGRADNDDMEPTLAWPVLTVSDDEAAFQLGGSGTIDFQWQPNALVDVFCATEELPAPLPQAPFGELRIDTTTMIGLGAVVCDAAGVAQLAYALPNAPALQGLRFVLQGAATTGLPGGARISTFQAFTIR